MDLGKIKKDKGVAGLTILLSVVVLLFIVGLFVMIFAIMGGELDEYADERTVLANASSGNTTFVNQTETAFANASLVLEDDVTCTIINVTEANVTNVNLGSGNYTQGTGVRTCYLTASADVPHNGTGWLVFFGFQFDRDTVASGSISNTTTALSGTTDWFDIFIVITAMVVLILLTVIIITAIRGSGLLSGGTGGAGRGGGNIGSA